MKATEEGYTEIVELLLAQPEIEVNIRDKVGKWFLPNFCCGYLDGYFLQTLYTSNLKSF